ncbi:hypothetical protein H4R24_002980 [Coemansia sp. RSA 988]|nr:hypothetical protein H4R24_002980 [Coemansia sp. RSA 988]
MSIKRGHSESETAATSIGEGQANGSSDGTTLTHHTQTKAQPYSTYQEAHDALLSLRGSYSESEILETGQRALLSVCTPELPSAVRQMGVRLAMQLCAHPETDTVQTIENLVQALDTAEPSVCCEIYQALVDIHELKGVMGTSHVPEKTRHALDRAVHRDLNHSQHHLRSASLLVLSAMQGPAPDTVLEAMCRYCSDSHPKVRQAALGGILQQHMMGVGLAVEMYDDFVVATKDDFEQVRLVAMELVWAISSSWPEHPVVIQQHGTSETIRLLDDAFVKLCDMVNDSSVVVRQRACAILGRFTDVSSRFLAQTFSKQVMSHLRRFVPRGRGYAGRNRGVRAGQAAIPTPKGDADVESEEFKLLDSGAAGAFVHGLEDEYQEVRDAAIESITELSFASAEFSAKAVDFLVDMFNDSSDRVRLCAIRALVAIGRRALLQLTEEQLSIALSAMRDASASVRRGVYSVLSVSSLAKGEWLQRLMDDIRGSLVRHPGDQLDVYQALALLGRTHTQLIDASFVRTLLDISEHYLNREARIDDPVYAGNVILIMNTVRGTRQRLATVLPDYVFSHLPYLRDKYPGCLPSNIADSVPEHLAFVRQMLDRPRTDPSIANLSLEDSRSCQSAAFTRLQEVLNQTQASHRNPVLLSLLGRRLLEFEQLSKSNNAKVGNSDSSHKAVANYALHVRQVLQIQDLLNSEAWRQSEVIGLAAKIMYGAYELESRFLGLDPCCLLALAYLRVFAHTVWLIAHITAQHDPKLVETMYGELELRIQRVSSALHARSIETPELGAFVVALGNKGFVDDAINSTPLPSLALIQIASDFRPLAFNPRSCLQHTMARLAAAPSVTRRAVEFNHLFPLNLSLSASLEWVVRREDVLVALRLPEQQVIVLNPPPSSLSPLCPHHWDLEWDDIPASLPLGSGESTTINLTIAQRQTADIPWSDSFIVAGNALPTTYRIGDYYKAIANPALLHIRVEISNKPHTVAVNPVEFKPLSSAHTRG